MTNFLKRINEKNIFLLVLLINCLVISTVRFYPSADGPSHLYNSNLIAHLLNGNSDEISNYFVLETVKGYDINFIDVPVGVYFVNLYFPDEIKRFKVLKL